MKDLIRLLGLLRPYSGWMLAGILISLLALLANIVLMAVSGWFISAMALAGIAGVSMNYFTPAAIIRAAAIVRTAGRYAERLVTHEATFRLLTELRVWFYHQLEPLVPAALEAYRSGDLFSRIQADIDSLNDFYLRILVPLLVAIATICIVTLFASRYDSTLAWTLFSLLFFAGMVLPVLIAKAGHKPGVKQIRKKSELRTAVVDGVQGVGELIVSGAGIAQERLIAQTSAQLIGTQRHLAKLASLSMACMIFFAGGTLWLVIILAIPLLREQVIKPAELSMLALFALAAFEAVIPLPESFRMLGHIQAAARRLFVLVDRKPLIEEPLQPADQPESFIWKFQAVSLQYQTASQPTLENISLDIHPAKKVAIVGPTGAGKSTLLQLLLKHRLPDQGSITLSAKPLTDYSSADLHRWISVVPQQPYIFNDTLKANLQLANPQATEDDIQRVLQIAQLSDFVATQKDGLNSWAGETGIKLSGGQMKRLAIARALLKEDYQLLLMDEPTEGLDSQLAKQVLDNIFRTLGKRSLLMITHQLSGLETFDEILFMEKGKIIERGTYQELLARKARFYELLTQALIFTK